MYFSAYSLTSPPVQNARSPAPVRTTTPTASSNDASRRAVASSSRHAVEYALYRVGRSIVIRATPAAFAYRISRNPKLEGSRDSKARIEDLLRPAGDPPAVVVDARAGD